MPNESVNDNYTQQKKDGSIKVSYCNRIQRQEYKEIYTPSNQSFNVEEGLKFLLTHFDLKSIFPRTIMTKKLGYQKEVLSIQDIMNFYEDSNFLDCRINAFPSFIDYKGIQRYPPDFIFIDLDKNNFKTESLLKNALSKALKNIKEKLDNGYPTVLWTGNGYHIYQPIDSFVLEQVNIFSEFENPSKQFLRFAKDFLSGHKADPSNNQSFKSCLLRIPCSFNSKCLDKQQQRQQNCKIAEVKIIQKWDGNRPSIKYLLRDFRRYLINQKIKQNQGNYLRNLKINKRCNRSYAVSKTQICWIEKLLQSPIEDYRKNSISLILAPYLVTIKKLQYKESFDIINNWLTKCSLLRKLNFNSSHLINSALNTAYNKKIPPMKLETLKNINPELYSNLYI